MRLTKRFIIKSLENIDTGNPIRYERYYINDILRIQKKGDIFEKEILDDQNNILEKININKNEFEDMKKHAYAKIIRDSFIYLKDNRVSIKKYFDNYNGLIRVEVAFKTIDEMKNYKKESWMGEEITKSPLAFDKYLSKLSLKEFSKELEKYIER